MNLIASPPAAKILPVLTLYVLCYSSPSLAQSPSSVPPGAFPPSQSEAPQIPPVPAAYSAPVAVQAPQTPGPTVVVLAPDHRTLAPTLPYRAGQVVPPGYQVEERSRKGLVISGGIVFGIPYFASVTTAMSSNDSYKRWLLLPVTGPFLTIAERPKCEDTDCIGAVLGDMLLVLDGIMQVTGATLLTVGIAARKQVLVRQDLVEAKRPAAPVLSITPTTFGSSGAGVVVSGLVF